jgi:hypothetical protein
MSPEKNFTGLSCAGTDVGVGGSETAPGPIVFVAVGWDAVMVLVGPGTISVTVAPGCPGAVTVTVGPTGPGTVTVCDGSLTVIVEPGSTTVGGATVTVGNGLSNSPHTLTPSTLITHPVSALAGQGIIKHMNSIIAITVAKNRVIRLV